MKLRQNALAGQQRRLTTQLHSESFVTFDFSLPSYRNPVCVILNRVPGTGHSTPRTEGQAHCGKFGEHLLGVRRLDDDQLTLSPP
jgi:hypothetical protein